MPETWTIRSVRPKQHGSTPCWEIVYSKPDGTHHGHLMPQDIFEWRAAEYDIPVEDIDTLISVVVHEPHMPVVDHGDDAQARYADAGPSLGEAASTTAARAAHLARIPLCPVSIKTAGVEALSAIRLAHRPDPAVMRARREVVDIARWQHMYGDLPLPAPEPHPAGMPLTTPGRGWR